MNKYFPKDRFPSYPDFRTLVTSVAKRGDKTFYRYIIGKNEVRELSYKQFSDNIMKLSTALYALGLKNKRIALISEARVEWFQAYLSTLCAGAVIVPIDKDLMPEQIINFTNVAECDAVFVSPTCKERLGTLLEESSVKYIIEMTEEDYIPFKGSYETFRGNKKYNFYDLVAYGRHLIDAGFLGVYDITYDIDAMAALIFTSGTTGTSKGVMLSQRNLLACAWCCANSTPFTPDDVFLSVLPMHHTYETTIQIAILIVGSTICINNSIKYVMRNLKRFQPTGLVLVPLFVQTIFKRISEEIRKKGKENTFNKAVKVTRGLRKIKVDLRRPVFSEVIGALGGKIKNIICGGAALDEELVRRFEEFGINLYQGYGITECSPLVSVNPYTKMKHASIGLPVKCCDVKILKEVAGRELYAETREHGEIIVKGDNVMLGYYKNAEATKEAFTSDGFFRTGDIGYFDDDGYLYITGRKKNLIILSNGKNVYPEEIEEYLLRLDSIKECAVIARNNELGEPVITAIIVPEDSVLEMSDADIQNRIKTDVLFVNDKLPSFKQIRNIEIRKTDFEKTSSQKIKRYVL